MDCSVQRPKELKKVRNLATSPLRLPYPIPRLRGFGAPGGRKSLYPIDWRYRPYNSVRTNVLYCDTTNSTARHCHTPIEKCAAYPRMAQRLPTTEIDFCCHDYDQDQCSTTSLSPYTGCRCSFVTVSISYTTTKQDSMPVDCVRKSHCHRRIKSPRPRHLSPSFRPSVVRASVRTPADKKIK